MRIKDFVLGRNVELQAVQKYIIRHPELFDGHVDKTERNMELDEVAVEILEKKYPLPQPITIINGVPSEEYEAVLKQLAQKSDIIIQLQHELLEAKTQLLEEKNKILLLESKEKLLEEHISDINASAEEKIEFVKKMAENDRERLQNQNDELQKELDRLKSRSLWDRIRNK